MTSKRVKKVKETQDLRGGIQVGSRAMSFGRDAKPTHHYDAASTDHTPLHRSGQNKASAPNCRLDSKTGTREDTSPANYTIGRGAYHA